MYDSIIQQDNNIYHSETANFNFDAPINKSGLTVSSKESRTRKSNIETEDSTRFTIKNMQRRDTKPEMEVVMADIPINDQFFNKSS